ncbi:GTPase [Toxoplasma gondii p89]|uniref:GTPase n=1 Tax=Toxoplasma gondii p89 TaxID=943119 RepID=A0A086KY95_TOXGO|nr:GTPase [Toxoplasma gondii p89]
MRGPGVERRLARLARAAQRPQSRLPLLGGTGERQRETLSCICSSCMHSSRRREQLSVLSDLPAPLKSSPPRLGCVPQLSVLPDFFVSPPWLLQLACLSRRSSSCSSSSVFSSSSLFSSFSVFSHTSFFSSSSVFSSFCVFSPASSCSSSSPACPSFPSVVPSFAPASSRSPRCASVLRLPRRFSSSASFVDSRLIRVYGGRGGPGSCSYAKHAKHILVGPGIPSGGKGGDGGSVILRVVSGPRGRPEEDRSASSSSATDMSRVFSLTKKAAKAARVQAAAASVSGGLGGLPGWARGEDGSRGGKHHKPGEPGRDTVLLVPPGSVVWELRPLRSRSPISRNLDPAQTTRSSLSSPASSPVSSAASSPVSSPVSSAASSSVSSPVSSAASSSESAGPARLRASSEAFDGSTSEVVPSASLAPGFASSPDLLDFGCRCERRFLGELLIGSPPLVVARGGRGGRGNSRADPHRADCGEEGEEKVIEVELKSIADVGLVGFPNAGKSSILAALSRCAPRVASFPFTTTGPNVGSVSFENGDTLSVADLPGLVQNAHLNEGMGHAFLRHCERTSLLVYVLDASGDSATELDADPTEQSTAERAEKMADMGSTKEREEAGEQPQVKEKAREEETQEKKETEEATGEKESRARHRKVGRGFEGRDGGERENENADRDERTSGDFVVGEEARTDRGRGAVERPRSAEERNTVSKGEGRQSPSGDAERSEAESLEDDRDTLSEDSRKWTSGMPRIPRSPVDAFFALYREVCLYSASLATRPFIVAATKCDINPAKTLETVDRLWRELNSPHQQRRLARMRQLALDRHTSSDLNETEDATETPKTLHQTFERFCLQSDRETENGLSNQERSSRGLQREEQAKREDGEKRSKKDTRREREESGLLQRDAEVPLLADEAHCEGEEDPRKNGGEAMGADKVPGGKQVQERKEAKTKLAKIQVVAISARHGHGLEALAEAMRAAVEAHRGDRERIMLQQLEEWKRRG